MSANRMERMKRRIARRVRLGIAAAAAYAIAISPLSAQTVEAGVVQNVGRYDVNLGPAGSVATYYFYTTTTGWGAASCPNAYWAYYYSDKVGAKDLFSLIMQAKQMGKQLYIWGTCNGTAYFQIVGGAIMQ